MAGVNMDLSEILGSLKRDKKDYGTPLVCIYQFLTSNFNFK